MTQNTQTTAERIRAMIFDAIQETAHYDEASICAPLGVIIAAEIDALTAERDEARVERDLAQKAWDDYQLYRPKPASEDALLKQLAEARAEVERLREASQAGWKAAAGWARRYWSNGTQQPSEGEEKAGLMERTAMATRIAELESEAKAFRAWEAYDENPTTLTRNTFWTAAARARAAKGEK